MRCHTFFFETKYILIENKIQNNSFQKTEIFNPFPHIRTCFVLRAWFDTCECALTIHSCAHCTDAVRRGSRSLREKTTLKPHLSINSHLESQHFLSLSYDSFKITLYHNFADGVGTEPWAPDESAHPLPTHHVSFQGREELTLVQPLKDLSCTITARARCSATLPAAGRSTLPGVPFS